MSSDHDYLLFPTLGYCKTIDSNSEEITENVSTSTIEVSDPAKILQLCESLIDKCTTKLEVKINKYVSIY